jgi:hypothetical protein
LVRLNRFPFLDEDEAPLIAEVAEQLDALAAREGADGVGERAEHRLQHCVLTFGGVHEILARDRHSLSPQISCESRP